MDPDDLQLRDVVPAEPFIEAPLWPWWSWILIGLGVLLVAVWIRYSRQKANQVQFPDLTEREALAYQKAAREIEEIPERSPVQETATICSSAIRRYLATVTGDPSLFETHEEFLARHESLSSYPDNLRSDVSDGFSDLARFKYGKSPTGNPSDVAADGRALLDQLHQHRPA